MTEAGRFRGVAPHYVKGRHGYPQPLLDATGDLVGLGASDRMLDLGCGPGYLALGYAPRVAEAVAMDPEPEMLEAARPLAARIGRKLTFVLGGSSDLGPHLGCFRLVTMGQSFHWMDREPTLAALDRLVEPGGAIALFHVQYPSIPANAWYRAWRAVRERYSPILQQERASGRNRLNPERDGHVSVLRRSRFTVLRQLDLRAQQRVDLDQLVARALSTSSNSPPVLGASRAAFESEMRAVLRPYAPDGTITEYLNFQSLVASRPGDPQRDPQRAPQRDGLQGP